MVSNLVWWLTRLHLSHGRTVVDLKIWSCPTCLIHNDRVHSSKGSWPFESIFRHIGQSFPKNSKWCRGYWNKENRRLVDALNFMESNSFCQAHAIKLGLNNAIIRRSCSNAFAIGLKNAEVCGEQIYLGLVLSSYFGCQYAPDFYTWLVSQH